MANVIYLTIKEERSLDFDLKPKYTGEVDKSVYINSDEMSAYIGGFDTIEELEEIIAPEKIIESINENLSEYESDCILSLLECNDYKYQLGYYPCKEVRVAIKK